MDSAWKSKTALGWICGSQMQKCDWCFLLCHGTFQNVSRCDSAWCTSVKWIPPENQKRLSDESLEVWHIETFTSLECFSVKLFQCGEVCGRSAATGDISVAFLCSLRCLADWGAKLYKPIGVRFIGSNSYHKSVASMSLKHQESIRRYFTSVSHLIQPNFHPLALHLSII